MPSAVVAASVLALTLPAGAHATAGDGAGWRPPLASGEVGRAFTFDATRPYVGGRRRGIELLGAPGTAVRAVCGGVVTFAGPTPARPGLGIAVRCGRGGLVATELGLTSASVRRGHTVLAGTIVGRLGARGVLWLSARRSGTRQGYVDPAALLEGREPAGPAARPHVRRPAARRAAPPPAGPVPAGVPVVAWAGLALAGAGLGGRAAVARRRARRLAAGAPVVER